MKVSFGWTTLAAATAAITVVSGRAELPELQRHTISHDGLQRTYALHVPLNRPPTTPRPTVFVLHGGGGADAAEMARRTGMNRLADREDVLVVYPAGVDGQWNDGRGKSFRRGPTTADADDVGFIAAVMTRLIDQGLADPRRIYVMGLSNGGMMTFRLGIELGDRLAAIASVIANLPEALAARTPVRPLPVLVINGTADPMMPWEGGPVRVLGREFGTVLSTERTVRYWVDAAALPPQPERRMLHGQSAGETCSVEVHTYRQATGPVEVVLYRINGGGHTLPGADTPDRPGLLGRKCPAPNGPEVIWQFFARHALAPRANPIAAAGEPDPWQPRVAQVGDSAINYGNVEFTRDGRYMVWFEGVGGNPTNGIVWHCAVDRESGRLDPPDGRGFRAFESTSWGRANPGHDQAGPYYVGADREGRLVLVRPEGARQGRVARLPTPPDPRRRAIYPTQLSHRAGGFVFFIQNEKTPGAGVRPLNQWVELQYIDLAAPANVRVVERQNTPARGFAAMDSGFARWMRDRPLLTYGSLSSASGKVTIRGFDAERPPRGSFVLVANDHTHVDPYPAVIGDHEFILAGIDDSATSHVYRRPAAQAAETPFTLFRVVSPPRSRLARPSLAQSHEPFTYGGRLYTAYQVNEQGRGFFDTTFRQPGEIWLADVSSDPIEQWLIAPGDGGTVAEPEPLVTGACGWVFYSRPVVEGERSRTAAEARPTPPRTAGRGGLLLRRPAARQRSAGAFPRLMLYRAELPICQGR